MHRSNNWNHFLESLVHILVSLTVGYQLLVSHALIQLLESFFGVTSRDIRLSNGRQPTSGLSNWSTNWNQSMASDWRNDVSLQSMKPSNHANRCKSLFASWTCRAENLAVSTRLLPQNRFSPYIWYSFRDFGAIEGREKRSDTRRGRPVDALMLPPEGGRTTVGVRTLKKKCHSFELFHSSLMMVRCRSVFFF